MEDWNTRSSVREQQTGEYIHIHRWSELRTASQLRQHHTRLHQLRTIHFTITRLQVKSKTTSRHARVHFTVIVETTAVSGFGWVIGCWSSDRSTLVQAHGNEQYSRKHTGRSDDKDSWLHSWWKYGLVVRLLSDTQLTFLVITATSNGGSTAYGHTLPLGVFMPLKVFSSH